jgi:HK97 family phage major capsid protein
MSNELLQKVIDTTTVGADNGGLLKPEQSNRFIDYMFDATILTRAARTIRMRADTTEIDKVGVGERLMVLATEGSAAGQTDRGATFTKVSLTTKKLRLDWELSSESLEDNIEGADLEDHIARLMATQAGNDVEDLAINGDTALSSNNLLKAFNGFRKLALNGGNVVDAGGATITKAVFNNALKNMPRKYKQRRNQLRFFTGSNLVQDYLYNLTTVGSTPEDIASSILRGNPAAPDGAPGGVIPFAFGIPVVEVPLIDETRAGDYSGATGQHGEVHLTFPNNFIIGIKRDVTVYREFKPKKDTIEYTLFIRVGVAVENLDSFVVVKNVKVAS